MANVKPIPEGSHSITAGLVVKDAKKAIDFYQNTLGAKLLSSMDAPRRRRDARRARVREAVASRFIVSRGRSETF